MGGSAGKVSVIFIMNVFKVFVVPPQASAFNGSRPKRYDLSQNADRFPELILQKALVAALKVLDTFHLTLNHCRYGNVLFLHRYGCILSSER